MLPTYLVDSSLPPLVFVIHNKKDELQKEDLLGHLGVLKSSGRIRVWSEDQIVAGEDREAAIDQKICEAKIAILLITADFLNSEFIRDHVIPKLLERKTQEKSERLIIVPVIAKYCFWSQESWLCGLQVLPKNEPPVWKDNQNPPHATLTCIAEEIASIVTKLQEEKVASSTPNVTESENVPVEENNTSNTAKEQGKEKVYKAIIVVISLLVVVIAGAFFLTRSNNILEESPIFPVAIEAFRITKADQPTFVIKPTQSITATEGEAVSVEVDLVTSNNEQKKNLLFAWFTCTRGDNSALERYDNSKFYYVAPNGSDQDCIRVVIRNNDRQVASEKIFVNVLQ